ncbi:MAG: GAF domain-containing protein [Actinobacteria bacterium]|nr:MAG: GAF domain-containing protein [Actinomycetota bacterium]
MLSEPVRRVEEELRRSEARQVAIARLGRLAHAARDPAALLDEAAGVAAEGLDAEWTGVLEVGPRGELNLRATPDDSASEPTAVDAVARLALAADEPVVVADLQGDERLGAAGSGPGSGVSAAIRWRGRSYGVLVACSSRQGAFSAEDARLLRAAANVLAEALELARSEAEQRRLATALETERTRLRALVESIPAGVVLAEAPTGTITIANRHVSTILRRPVAPHTGFGLLQPDTTYHPDGSRYHADELPLLRSIAHGEVITGEEVDVVLGDGTRATLSVSSAPVRDLLGNIVAAVATFFDVSVRKTEQSSLQLHRALLEAQGEASIEGILVVSPEGRMISFNRRFGEMWNLSAEVLESGSDEEAIRAVSEQLVDPDAFLARINELYDSPDATSTDEIAFLDGRTFDRYSAPLIGEGGERYGRIWFFRDMTERKRAEEHQRFLAETSAALEASLDLPTVVKSVCEACVPFLADFCEINLVQDGAIVRLAGRAADAARGEAAVEIEREPIDPRGDHPVAVAVRTGELRSYDTIPPVGVIGAKEAEAARRLGLRGGIVAPLRARGRTVGALALGRTRVASRSDEVELAGELARRAALAIDNVQLYERERTVAETLQRSLLPQELPQPPGLALAARYLPGGRGIEVGGDWYDAIPLPDGGTALVIGDVVGRGLRAASVMGHLRNVARVYALDGTPPARAAAAMNRLVETIGQGEMATMLYAVLEPDLTTLRMASAGHPPPLVVHPDGRAEYLEGGRSLPFGAMSHIVYDEASGRLEPGSTLLLYTDGLIERRGEPLEKGLTRLADIAVRAGEDVEGFCDHVLSALADGHDSTDDVALLAVRVLPPERGALHLRLPADPLALAALRQSLTHWLRQNEASDHEIFEIVFACNEAAANAIEHAYGLEQGSFEFEAHMNGAEMVAVVRDFGRWRPARGQNRGRGLELVHRMMDSAEVVPHERGTEVRLRRRLNAGSAR